MSLVSQGYLLQTLGIQAGSGDPLYDQYDNLRQQSERLVKQWCKWRIEANDGLGQGNFIEYVDCKSYFDVVLRNPWVAYVTSVFLDQQGAYGQYNQGFGSGTLLTNGADYSMVWEGPGRCKSGILRRLGNNGLAWSAWPSNWAYSKNAGGLAYNPPPWWPSGFGNMRILYDWGFEPETSIVSGTWSGGVATITFSGPMVIRPTDQFTIAGCTPSGWNGTWSVASVAANLTSITCRMGVNPGTMTGLGTADFIPLDIKSAVCQSARILQGRMRYGGQLTGEGLGDYNYNLNIDAAEWGSVRQTLSGWRDFSEGLALG